MTSSILDTLAGEMNVQRRQVEAAAGLLDDGATVPFIARYRKELTGGLDDGQLRYLEERLGYLRELEDRRTKVLESIGEQGGLSRELEAAIRGARTKARLEDLYLPFRPRRRTKAQIAKEAGLGPLALMLLEGPDRDPSGAAMAFVAPRNAVHDAAAALDGARQILMERFAEDACLLGELREYLWSRSVIRAGVVSGREEAGRKFADYFDYAEPVKSIPSHRALALFRGRREGVLNLELDPGGEEGHAYCAGRVARRFAIVDEGRAGDSWLLQTAHLAWKVKLFTHLDLELKMRLREQAEDEAIRVFGENLRDLLLAAPAGQLAIMGLDPGLRTGVKVAVVDATGKVIETDTVFPHAPRNRRGEALERLAVLASRTGVQLVAIGNGTGSRETEGLVRDLMARHPELNLRRLIVSEAGASVYSASELAAGELPELDVSLRGAVSIARRLQDPLAELVKIEPKAIGVGQYQHDVSQTRLGRKLDNVVEDCVNAVGVNVNTASPALLARVAGLGRAQAHNIVAFRDKRGPFRNRKQIKGVPRLGDKTFEQAAGFLRVTGGDNPLDGSAVHPEAYPVVERILGHTGRSVGAVMGNRDLLSGLKAQFFVDERFGLPTVRDILEELEKPGRDPRGEFSCAEFDDGVTEIAHLKTGMILEGTVTNVANFGAFVDIGVHQDGLLHISAMSSRFVRDPREVVKTGDTVRVRVLDVDQARRRIALSLRLDEDPARRKENPGRRPEPAKTAAGGAERGTRRPAGAMEQALSAALKKG